MNTTDIQQERFPRKERALMVPLDNKTFGALTKYARQHDMHTRDFALHLIECYIAAMRKQAESQ